MITDVKIKYDLLEQKFMMFRQTITSFSFAHPLSVYLSQLTPV